MHALRWVNLSFLVLYPVSWTAPLAYAGFLPFFRGSELSIVSGIVDLWETDIALAMIVAALAVVAPFLKTLLLLATQFGITRSARLASFLVVAGKLAMADVFLLAVYIVIIKGVGVGHVSVGWGLYLFTALTLASLGIALLHQKGANS